MVFVIKFNTIEVLNEKLIHRNYGVLNEDYYFIH